MEMEYGRWRNRVSSERAYLISPFYTTNTLLRPNNPGFGETSSLLIKLDLLTKKPSFWSNWVLCWPIPHLVDESEQNACRIAMRGVLVTIKLPHGELAEDCDRARKCFLSSPLFGVLKISALNLRFAEV